MKRDTKRYNLTLPDDLYKELSDIAEQQHTTVVHIIRRFMKLGLLVVQANASPDMAVILREGDREREILFL